MSIIQSGVGNPEDYPAPFHVKVPKATEHARVEITSADGSIRSDPRTAHEVAGDSAFQLFLIDDCYMCMAVQAAAEGMPDDK